MNCHGGGDICVQDTVREGGGGAVPRTGSMKSVSMVTDIVSHLGQTKQRLKLVIGSIGESCKLFSRRR